MPEKVARAVALFLLVVHAGLGLWAAVGLAELAVATLTLTSTAVPAVEVPWPTVSNPLFSRGMLLLQWALIATAAGVFTVGYLRRWRHTPVAMAVVYGSMALVCAYQTFFILESPTRFRAMAVEYVEYAAILLFLFFSRHARLRFA